MTEANRVGVATPPSVLLHALRHNAVRADMRRELDIQFLRFATGNSRIEGRTFLGQNMSATAARAGAHIAKMRGQNVMTFTDFKEMAGRAVFDLDPFEVNGFPVVPEAREVADAWKRIAEKYDAVQRDLGMYRDQNGLRSTVQKADNRLLRLRDQMARFLWKTPGLNERTTPSSLRAAVRVGERVFTGETHDEAMMAVIDQFGPEGSRMVGELPPEAFGWSITDARKSPDAAFGGVPLTTRLQDANGDPLPLNHGTGSWFSRFAKEMRGSNTEAKDAFDGVFFATNPDFAEGFAGAEGGRVIKAFGDAANPVEYLPGEYGGFFEGGRWSDLIAEARREGNDAVIFKDYEFAGGKTDIVVMLDENNIFVDGESFVGLTAKEAEFRTFEQTVADRVETLPEGARAVYEDMSQQLARLEAEHSGAKQALDTLRDKPHRFVDQQGRTEGYFTRYYHKPKIMEARAKFTRLIKHIFSKDNPAGAAERAEAFVDDLLGLSDNADEGPVAATGMRHLNERKIDVPNSFRVDDPEYGELRLSDFIETDIEVISDTYIRRAGARIEMTRAYGDPQMWDKLHEAEMHWREKNLTPDMTPAQIKAARAEWDEYKGWVELARDDVLGTLKTADPWRMDNKWARRLSNTANLTLLGSVIKSVPPELVRNPMVNGWGTAFKAIFTDWFRDLDELKLDRATRLETGELVDMMLTTAGSQLHEINTADVRAGSSFDRGLNNLQNPFFKANGLTPWTTWQKTAVHIATQHRVMKEAVAIADAVKAGRDPDAKMVARNAALGISLSDNLVLAKMPFEKGVDGLIKPAVQNWKGGEGRMARTKLLGALAGESGRTVVTPRAGDLPLPAKGVFAFRGKKVFESDLLGLFFKFGNYGLAATQKIALSGLQGRDQAPVSGVLAMFMLGAFSVWLKTPENAWRNKSYEDILLESYEASGVGGYFLNDINKIIETYSMQTIGLRPALGLDPQFANDTEMAKYARMLGPGGAAISNITRALIDPELSTSNRAQLIRRTIPGATLFYLNGITRDLVSAATGGMDE
jgi:hypothetical protein